MLAYATAAVPRVWYVLVAWADSDLGKDETRRPRTGWVVMKKAVLLMTQWILLKVLR